jgi:catechol 2,3-dioxygenase-like lactoylglutathione lyase family enzyme
MIVKITRLELFSVDLQAQKNFYSQVLELPVEMNELGLLVHAGTTELVFRRAPGDFDGAYHFAFNIPENQYASAKQWLTRRIAILKDKTGKEDFESQNWNSSSLYFLDAAGNVLEFIARRNLQNTVEGDFNSSHILNVSEIGLPSENVIELANELCTRLGLPVFKQQAHETFTPVGDDEGLFILPVRERIWMPDSGVPAKMLPVHATGTVADRAWDVRGVPYEINIR